MANDSMSHIQLYEMMDTLASSIVVTVYDIMTYSYNMYTLNISNNMHFVQK